MAYITWQDVVDIYPKASIIESTGANQTALITAKTNYFTSLIRNIHKDALSEPVDEVVKLAVANLVVDELQMRRRTDDDDLTEWSFDHISGRFTDAGMRAHSLIQSIRKGAIVLGQDFAERDLLHPEPVVVTQTGTGEVQTWLPHGWRGDAKSRITVIFTTAGRVEDTTAVYSVYVDYGDDDPLVSGETVSASWGHVGEGLYIRFVDKATTGNSFEVDDEFLITVAPLNAEAMTAGPSNFDMYTS